MMKTRFVSFFAIFVSLLGVNILSGCSSKPVNENDPKEMYEDAEQDINNDRYLLALDKLRVVKSKFSYSNYGALAQLRIGDVYFLQESYPEAAAAYETFVELYPKHAKAPYALFRSGESYFNDIPSTISRDLRSADNALATFTQYERKYPAGEFLDRARDMKKKAYNKLAQKEYDIAEFYVRRKKNTAARTRFQKIVDQFPDSEIVSKAKEQLQTLPND